MSEEEFLIIIIFHYFLHIFLPCDLNTDALLFLMYVKG